MSTKQNIRVPAAQSRRAVLLSRCMVDADSEFEVFSRNTRRASLIISSLLQGVVLAAVLLIPLLMKPTHIALANAWVPIPTYVPSGHVSHPTHNVDRKNSNSVSHCVYCPPRPIPLHPTGREGREAHGNPDEGEFISLGEGIECRACVPISSPTSGPIRPDDSNTVETRLIHTSHVDTAMLTHRVEPLYPPLAIQTRREGRVELHAIIGTDGAIRSLQVVSGDALFHRSALGAVSQWKFRPTMLNGQAVNIDTYITVIYSLGRR